MPVHWRSTRPHPQPKSRTDRKDSKGLPILSSAFWKLSALALPDSKNHSTFLVPVAEKMRAFGGIGGAPALRRAARFLRINCGFHSRTVRQTTNAGGNKPRGLRNRRSLLSGWTAGRRVAFTRVSSKTVHVAAVPAAPSSVSTHYVHNSGTGKDTRRARSLWIMVVARGIDVMHKNVMAAISRRNDKLISVSANNIINAVDVLTH